MPLVLRLNPGEKIIINGVVIENTGGLSMLAIRNRGNILRQKDILQLEDAATPALRVYYTLQCVYLFPDEAKVYSDALRQFLNDFELADPTSKPIIDALRMRLDKGELYQGLKDAKRLVKYEWDLLGTTTERAKQLLLGSDGPKKRSKAGERIPEESDVS
ncbi:MAG: flagellum biosynthesis protein FlbT [Alphaproteobacteria bacterium]|nr:flagellum biosynthesis protein FlbT [Alphaproteobacteria bacterium]